MHKETEANCCDHCCSLKLWNMCLALPEKSLAACLRHCSLIQEVVLLRRKTNHRWCSFCFFMSAIHFNRQPSVVCRWHFFNPLETPWMHHRQSVAKLAGVMCVLLVLSSSVWRLQHYLLLAGSNGRLCLLDVCQGWNKYLYFPITYSFSPAPSASKMLILSSLKLFVQACCLRHKLNKCKNYCLV